ncbi:MAG: hypothetical protein PF904_11340 [Kiritimatiellae bacterium]|jgi:alpha-L-fucosidase 2|nr:hypothetical protein [Kiritimatiellia bacterium]
MKKEFSSLSIKDILVASMTLLLASQAFEGKFPSACLDAAEIVGKHVGVRNAPPRDTPSKKLPDGNLLGNGDVGIAIGGPAENQSFYVGKNDFWAPCLRCGYGRGDAWGEGVSPAASRIGGQSFWIGGVSVRIPQLRGAEFHQEMDIFRAESRSRFVKGGIAVSMTAWLAATDNVLVVAITNAGLETVGICVDVSTGPNQLRAYMDEKYIRHPVNTSQAGITNHIMWCTRDSFTFTNDPYRCYGSIATRIIGADDIRFAMGDKLSAEGDFMLAPGKEVRIAAQIGSCVSFSKDFYLERIRDMVVQSDDALTPTVRHLSKWTPERIASLKISHREWWRAFYEKSLIELPGEPVIERFYYGALYMLGACSRAGKVCPPLFGSWATVDVPEWMGDYHMNYNHQHPFYGVYACNRPELAVPYFDSVNNLLPLAKKLAADQGRKGTQYQTGAGPYGWTYHISHGMPNNAELALNYIQCYRYTLDMDFLRDTAYPFIKEVALYWDNLIVREAAGDGYRYLIKSSWDERGVQRINPANGLAILRAFYKGLVQMSEDLNVDGGQLSKWRDIRDNLSHYPVTSYKGKTVFDFAEGANNPTGNPYPYNVYGFFPAYDLGLHSSEQQLLVNTLSTRPELWSQGNAFCEVFPAAVLGGYPVHEILEQFRNRITELMTPGLIVRQWGGGIETAGALAAVNAMFLQSHEGFLIFFPVWDSGQEARFFHLRAEGAFLVDAAFSGGCVTELAITSEKGKPCTVQTPWPGKLLKVVRSDGELIHATQNRDRFSFKTDSGMCYRLSPVEPQF